MHKPKINQNKPHLEGETSPDFTLIDKSKYICGIGGLAKLVGCSYPTALKFKDSGQISYLKIGKKIFFDREKVLQEISINKTV